MSKDLKEYKHQKEVLLDLQEISGLLVKKKALPATILSQGLAKQDIHIRERCLSQL